MSFFDRTSTVSADFRRLAQKRLPPFLFDFIDGGAFREETRQANAQDFQKIRLRKRVLKDVSNVDTTLEFLGQKLSLPLVLAPVGFAGVFARRGECQAAKAAEKCGIPFTSSVVGICSCREIRQQTSSPFWYQFYMLKDKGLALKLLDTAKEAQCPVLVLTIDLPSVGVRHRYQRSLNTPWPYLKHLKWFFDVRIKGGPLILGDIAPLVPHLGDLVSQRKWMSGELNASLTWKDLEWIRSHWPGKILVKGIMDEEDARLALDAPIDGLIVSNHGGRHIDSISSTIQTLSSIVNTVQKRLPIILDGGIRSGLDIVKALAMGADACMIGRAWAFALAARGEQGVIQCLNHIHQELQTVMAQLGVATLKEISSHLLMVDHTR